MIKLDLAPMFDAQDDVSINASLYTAVFDSVFRFLRNDLEVCLVSENRIPQVCCKPRISSRSSMLVVNVSVEIRRIQDAFECIGERSFQEMPFALGIRFFMSPDVDQPRNLAKSVTVE